MSNQPDFKGDRSFSSESFSNEDNQGDSESQDFQPESGSVDRQERMYTRQSSPTNPRVDDKNEDNQEEA